MRIWFCIHFNDKYFILQHPRQCICDFRADYFWGVLATPPHQIHLQRLLLLGDQILLHQCAQDDHGESDFFFFSPFVFFFQLIRYNCVCSALFLFFQSELPYATWQEVQARIVEIQKEHQICIHKKELTELDIYHRILRFKNYMVCCWSDNLTSNWGRITDINGECQCLFFYACRSPWWINLSSQCGFDFLFSGNMCSTREASNTTLSSFFSGAQVCENANVKKKKKKVTCKVTYSSLHSNNLDPYFVLAP